MNKTACPLCQGENLYVFLRRDRVPVHQNLVIADSHRAQSTTRGKMEVTVCEKCGFIFNKAFDPRFLAYGETYDNTQSFSPFFSHYLDMLVRELVEERGVHDCSIVEIGCGKGHFLRKLIEYPGANNRGFGFDPSYVGVESDVEGRLEFRRCFYDDSCTDVEADVVICRHVIEHIDQPLLMLRTVRSALGTSRPVKVFFETPCVEWILKGRILWDFFYEHCSIFSAATLRLAFGQAGFAVQRVEHVFGGQYLWLEGQPADHLEESTLNGRNSVEMACSYKDAEAMILTQWRKRLLHLSQNGKTALWGAGAKGATLAHLVDPERSLIDCVIDINPNKQGGYIPGTGHPIVSPLDLPVRGVRSAILMNPNYHSENLRLLKKAGIELDLINWSPHETHP